MERTTPNERTARQGPAEPVGVPKPDQKKMVYSFDRRNIFQVDPTYKIKALIGRGAYGLVASGANIKTGERVAVKLVKDLFRDPVEAKRELREIKILKFLKHKNIVSLLDIMRIEDPAEFNEIYLVMDYMLTNLRRVIDSKAKLIDKMIKYILFQILNGLYYMHSADIIHRDLKPQNILINNNCDLKIADMNLARKQDQIHSTNYVVTRPYRAPEVLLCSQSYTKSIDIWSVGCIFAEIIGRTILFQGKDCYDQLKKFVAVLGKPQRELYEKVDPIVKSSFDDMLRDMPDRNRIDWKTLYPMADPDGLDLLDHMLVYNPKERYTAEQCLHHPYFKQMQKEFPLPKCEVVFDFSFDEIPMETQIIRQAIYKEAESFNPQSTVGFKRERNSDGLATEEGPARKLRKEETSSLSN